MITEKIDGTNAAVGIVEITNRSDTPEGLDNAIVVYDGHGNAHAVYAQSRKRLITPGDDNYGFARWVRDNAGTLVADLGPGLHFGELWGKGINRGYGLDHKRWSLFNVTKWRDEKFRTPGLDVVPVLLEGEIFDTRDVSDAMELLDDNGSYAAPGFRPAEGVVVYHKAGNTLFKATLEGDEAKGMAA
jgi:hypothetical protein